MIATAHGEPGGGGATAYFEQANAMNGLTIGGANTELLETAKLTFKRVSNSKALVLTTAPFADDA